jgi:hypothetical protein
VLLIATGARAPCRIPSKSNQAMIKIRFQPAGMNAAQLVVPKEIESPVPLRVDDHVDYLNGGGKPGHLVVVSARYVVDDSGGAFYQLVSVAGNT